MEVLCSPLAWLGLAPHRVKAFCWAAVSGRVSTENVLRRRGLISKSISDLCSLCGKERKMIVHLFLHYEFSYFLWCQFLMKSGLVWCISKSLGDQFRARRASPFSWVRLGSSEASSVCCFMVCLGG